MNIEEAVKALNNLTEGDPEIAHGEADDILCKFLSDNGFREVADAYEEAYLEIGFWYA